MIWGERMAEAARRLLTVSEAAEQLRCSVKQLRRIIDSGALQVVRLGLSARSDRVHPDDLRAYIDSQRRTRPKTCQFTSVGVRGGLPSLSADKELEDRLASMQRARKRNN